MIEAFVPIALGWAVATHGGELSVKRRERHATGSQDIVITPVPERGGATEPELPGDSMQRAGQSSAELRLGAWLGSHVSLQRLRRYRADLTSSIAETRALLEHMERALPANALASDGPFVTASDDDCVGLEWEWRDTFIMAVLVDDGWHVSVDGPEGVEESAALSREQVVERFRRIAQA